MHCCNWLLLFLLFIYHFTAWNQPVVGHLISRNSTDTPQFPNMIVLQLPSSLSVSFLSFFNHISPCLSHCTSTASLLHSSPVTCLQFREGENVHGTRHETEIINQESVYSNQLSEKGKVSHCVTLAFLFFTTFIFFFYHKSNDIFIPLISSRALVITSCIWKKQISDANCTQFSGGVLPAWVQFKLFVKAGDFPVASSWLH